jgi:hypothetical protein
MAFFGLAIHFKVWYNIYRTEESPKPKRKVEREIKKCFTGLFLRMDIERRSEDLASAS